MSDFLLWHFLRVQVFWFAVVYLTMMQFSNYFNLHLELCILDRHRGYLFFVVYATIVLFTDYFNLHLAKTRCEADAATVKSTFGRASRSGYFRPFSPETSFRDPSARAAHFEISVSDMRIIDKFIIFSVLEAQASVAIFLLISELICHSSRI